MKQQEPIWFTLDDGHEVSSIKFKDIYSRRLLLQTLGLIWENVYVLLDFTCKSLTVVGGSLSTKVDVADSTTLYYARRIRQAVGSDTQQISYILGVVTADRHLHAVELYRNEATVVYKLIEEEVR